MAVRHRRADARFQILRAFGEHEFGGNVVLSEYLADAGYVGGGAACSGERIHKDYRGKFGRSYVGVGHWGAMLPNESVFCQRFTELPFVPPLDGAEVAVPRDLVLKLRSRALTIPRGLWSQAAVSTISWMVSLS